MQTATTRVIGVQFSPLPDTILKAGSFQNVTDPTTYNSNGIPNRNTVVDPRLGTPAYKYNCSTCFYSKNECPGHPGHVELNIATMSPIASKYLIQWLRIICHKCGSLLYKGAFLGKSVTNKYECMNCGYNQPKMKLPTPPIYIGLVDDNGEIIKWFPHEFAYVLESISDQIVKQMGYPLHAHPKYFINRNFPIASIITHPDVKQPGATSRTTHDPITTMYTSIVRINSNLRNIGMSTNASSQEHMKKINSMNEEERANRLAAESEWIHLLAFIYNCIKESSENSAELGFGIAGVNGSQNILMPLLPRMKGKGGYIRANIMGRIVTNMARAAITNNPTIEIDTIIVPQMFARRLRVSEIVQAFNFEKMQFFFQNGLMGKYPACHSITKKSTGQQVRLREGNNIADIILEIGDVVHRDLIDGDVCMFNRMPTLYYASMNKQRIIVSPDPRTQVISMNELEVTPFNADFDGDEMNVIIPANIGARIEIEELSSITRWFLGYTSGNPHFKLILTTVIMPALATREGVKFNLRTVMGMFGNTTIQPAFPLDKYPNDYEFSGREILSMILPKVNFSSQSAFYDTKLEPYFAYHPNEKQINVVRGQIKSGVCDKAFNGIFSIINHEYGARSALTAMYNVQQLSAHFTTTVGSSVGIRDLLLPYTTHHEIEQSIQALINSCKMLEEQLIANEIVPPVGMTVSQYIEKQSREFLTGDFFHVMMKDLNKDFNGLLNMVIYGATGAYDNMQKILVSVGQTTINNMRPTYEFSYKRMSPYFPRFDISPESMGYNRIAFVRGSTPANAYFMSKAARRDLLQKTAMTATTGYQSRMAVKNLELSYIGNFNECTNERFGPIIQSLYGDNGFDPRHVEMVRFPTVMISDEEFNTQFNFHPAEFAQLKADRELYRQIFMSMERYMTKMKMDAKLRLPLNIERIIDDILSALTPKKRGGANYGFENAENSDGTPLNSHTLPGHFEEFTWNKSQKNKEDELDSMRDQVSEFTDSLPYVFFNPKYAERRGYVPSQHRAAVGLIAMSVRSYLHTGTLKKIQEYDNPTRVLSIILKKAWLMLQSHVIDYGTPIGIISALCISEPVTQISLDSIHAKAPGDKQKDDLKQLKEVWGVTELNKCLDPVMTMFLLPGTTEERAREIANNLEMMKFESFIVNSQIFYEEFGEPVHPDFMHERELINEFARNSIIPKPDNLLKFCLRFELDAYLMILKNMQIQNIIHGIIMSSSSASSDYYFVYSSENSINNKLFLRIYLRSTVSISSLNDLRDLIEKIQSITVRGINGIMHAMYMITPVTQINEAGKIEIIKPYMIKTLGVNLSGIFMLREKIPEIDYRTVMTDNVRETARYFGIGAARMTVIAETSALLSNIAYCHFTLAADTIASKGIVTPITANGPPKRGANPLLLQAFEKPTQHIEKAVQTGNYAKTDGISPSLMIGQMPAIGSAFNSIIYDVEYKQESQQKEIEDLLENF